MGGSGTLQLTRYDEKGWRATLYTTGMEHSPTSATGTGWERTPWHAVQRAWEAAFESGKGGRSWAEPLNARAFSSFLLRRSAVHRLPLVEWVFDPRRAYFLERDQLLRVHLTRPPFGTAYSTFELRGQRWMVWTD
jgi:hypothetical protein